MKFRILKYVFKSISVRKLKVSLLILIVNFSLFITFYATQKLSNETYGFVISHTPISDYIIYSIADLQDITYFVKVSCINASSFLLYETDQNFKKFARRLLVEGRFPRNQREVLLIAGNKQNFSVGDEMLINGGICKIVGILDSERFPSMFNPYKQCVLIKISHNIHNNVYILIFGVSIFANITNFEIRIRNLVGEDKIVAIFAPEGLIQHFLVASSIFTSILISIVVLFLTLIDIRKEVALIFSVGWRYTDALKRIYIEISSLFLLSYITGITAAYFTIFLVFRYYFFLIFAFQFVTLLYLLIMILTFVFSRFFVLSKIEEVLLV